jgi:hypothetical protein
LEELSKLTPTDAQLFKLPWGPLQLVVGQIRPFKLAIKAQLAKEQEEEDKEDEDKEDEDNEDEDKEDEELEENEDE